MWAGNACCSGIFPDKKKYAFKIYGFYRILCPCCWHRCDIDTAGGAYTHCILQRHALGLAFVPRIPDLDGRCFYGFEPAKQYGILQNDMGDRIDADLIRAHWDDILRLMTACPIASHLSQFLLAAEFAGFYGLFVVDRILGKGSFAKSGRQGLGH